MKRSLLATAWTTSRARRGISALAAAVALCAVPATHAQQQIPSKVDIDFDRFYTADEMEAQLRRLANAYPQLCHLEQYGTSSLGRPMWMLIINNPKTGAEGTKPGMYIDGAIHANEIQSGETVLYTAWYLLKAHGQVPKLTEIVDRTTFYLIPLVNPDGRVNWFSKPNTPNSARSGQVPTDNDGDGLFDEDGPDDMNGDGNISTMWRRDPLGTHKRDPRDPNKMVAVPAEPRADGTREYGDWSFAGQEGFDNDGDGSTNEDDAGGYDMNRNFPSGWQPVNVQGGAGKYPLCFPETKSIVDFVLKHPEIAAAQAYHNAGGMILRGPGAQSRERDYPRQDVAVYDRIQDTGAQMLPFYKSMVIWKDLYTVHGGLVNWMAEGEGIISLTNELWNDKRMMQNGQEPTEEDRKLWNERMLFGQTQVPLQELVHPDYGTVLVGGGSKYSSRIPPPFMLEEEAHRNFAFTMFHADQLPLLRWESVETKQVSPGLWEVTATIANDRLIPTRTARAAEKRIGYPDELHLTGAPVATAGLLRSRLDRSFEAQDFRPAELRVERGVPGQGSLAARFLVTGAEGTPITLKYTAEKAKAIETSVKLGESTIKADPAAASAAPGAASKPAPATGAPPKE